MAIEAEQLREAVEGLRRPPTTEASDLTQSLDRVVEATRQIFGADGAGVMLIDAAQSLRYVGATDPVSEKLEEIQRETGQGPCVDSLILGTAIQTTDLADDPRWPLLRGASDRLGIRAVLGVPIRIGGSTVGSLNTYRATSDPWEELDVVAITTFGQVIDEIIGVAMLAEQRHELAEQLAHALEHRVTIERAIGVIMATRQLGATEAFQVLRNRARSERRKVADIAAELLKAFDPPRPA